MCWKFFLMSDAGHPTNGHLIKRDIKIRLRNSTVRKSTATDKPNENLLNF